MSILEEKANAGSKALEELKAKIASIEGGREAKLAQAAQQGKEATEAGQ